MRLAAQAVTPQDVIDDVQAKVAEFKSLYVVSIGHDGRPTLWASGNLNDLAYAALALQAKAQDYILDRSGQ